MPKPAAASDPACDRRAHGRGRGVPLPPSEWDARGAAAYAAFVAAAAAYFWVRTHGVAAMGPYTWCAASAGLPRWRPRRRSKGHDRR